MIALDPLEQLDAELFRADSRRRWPSPRRRPHRDRRRETRRRKSRMRQPRDVAHARTARRRRARARSPNAAHGSCRASAASCVARRVAVGRLGEPLARRAPASDRRRAPAGPASCAATALRLLARQQRRDRRRDRAAARSLRSPRSSISAGTISTGMPAASSSARRDVALGGKHQRLSAQPERHASRHRLPAALGQQLEHRRRGLLDRAAGHVDRAASCAWRRACARTRSPRPPPCGRYTGRRR